MGRRKRDRVKRIDAVAQRVLESEIRRNQEKIPAALPDSALWESHSAQDLVKRKILHPPRRSKPREKLAEEEYRDIWDNDPATSAATVDKRKRRIDLPTSEDSYRSAKHVTEEPKQTEGPVEIRDPIVVEGDEGSWVGDTLKDDLPHFDFDIADPVPHRKQKTRSSVEFNSYIPKHLPEKQRIEMKRLVKEGHKALREMEEREAQQVLPEEEPIDHKENKPKKEKDQFLQFVTPEPEYDITKIPQRLSEATADPRPFARLQRSFEATRTVPIHE